MTRASTADLDDPAIFRPWVKGEALTTTAAARRWDRHESTIRRLCEAEGLGRRFGKRGHWLCSRVAFQMYVDGNREALRAYLAGDRASELVLAYFRAEGLERELQLALRTAGLKEAPHRPAIRRVAT